MKGRTITISNDAYDLLVEERKTCLKNAFVEDGIHVPVTFVCPKIGTRASELILSVFGKTESVPPNTGVYKKKEEF